MSRLREPLSEIAESPDASFGIVRPGGTASPHTAVPPGQGHFEGLSATASGFIRFACVGASGLVINTLALALTTGPVGASVLVGLLLSTQVSTTTNFLLSERFVFTGRSHRRRAIVRFLQFAAVNTSALIARAPMVAVLTGWLGMHLLVANVVSLASLMVVRFAVADRIIWRGSRSVDVLGPALSLHEKEPADTGLSADTAPVRRSPARDLSPRLRRALAVATIAVPAVLLRIVYLNAVGFNSDEAVYAGQAASIAGDTSLQPYFPIFRAHPLLFQTTLSVIYQFGTSPLAGRLLAVAFGLATIVVTYRLGTLLYGRRAGLGAALFLAVMPYHVVVSRQVLLDVPMVFFSTLTLLFLARFASSGRIGYLYTTSAVMGLTIITNERSVVLVASAYIFLALAAPVRLRLRHLVISGVIFLIVVSPFPISLVFSGRRKTGGNFLSWQLFRRANHGYGFYAATVPKAIGLLLVLAAVAALWQARHRFTWRETLLVCWTVVPIVYYELWPVKGFQYLMPIAPVVAILAARAIALLASRDRVRVLGRPVRGAYLALAAVVVIAGLGVRDSWSRITPSGAGTSVLAGAGGVPGGREAGTWINEHVPKGATLLTVGPSMANLVQWYGDRKAYGLSVSPNPLHRNPVYEPIVNPDQVLRNNDAQYLVWDAYSASRSSFFSDKLLTFAERYHGRIVHRETVPGANGGPPRPVIVIYAVRP